MQITARNISLRVEGKSLLNEISFKLSDKESIAIVGKSGSGKTILGKTIAGYYQLSEGQLLFNETGVKRLFISQQHDFRYLSSTRSYYQQRYDSNVSDDSPTVEELLQKELEKKQSSPYDMNRNEWIRVLQLEPLLNCKLSQLSNGEGKRVQLAQALLQNTQVLVLDNPFIGLDVQARQLMHDIINQLIALNVVVFVITSYDEIPSAVTHVLELDEGRLKQMVIRPMFRITQKQEEDLDYVVDKELLTNWIRQEEENFSVAVALKNVKVSYGDKLVLNNINWTVKRGEKWALLGDNGAGKSTLLSLINGDNPQAYQNEIYLFDKRRGSGESIWDIKRKVGYISPELHIYFQRDVSHTEAVAISSGESLNVKFSKARLSCEEVIASGFNDQVGSSQTITSIQKKQLLSWMDILQIRHLQHENLYHTSLGEQRLVLLARALVKNPALLILDEPCQGLDKIQTNNFRSIVDEVCTVFNKTLIYISHYKQDIPKCVTHFLVLKKGEVIYTGDHWFDREILSE